MTARNVTLRQFAHIVGHRLEPKLREALVGGLRVGAMRLQHLVVEEIDNALPYPAVDTGGLRQSVGQRDLPSGSRVSVSAPHAGYIEHGTRPHWPPIDPLAAWAKRKGLALTDADARRIGFLVARKISRVGIAPRHFFAKAWARFRPEMRTDLRASLAAASRRP